MSVFEIMMLVCFGMAWPFSIYKSAVSKKVEGKSFIFLLIVFIGYISGIIHKLLYSYDRVIFLYMINAAMVAVDAVLYLRNIASQKRLAAQTDR